MRRLREPSPLFDRCGLHSTPPQGVTGGRSQKRNSTALHLMSTDRRESMSGTEYIALMLSLRYARQVWPILSGRPRSLRSTPLI